MAAVAVLEAPTATVNPIDAAERRLNELDRQAREWGGIAAAATAAMIAIVDEVDREGYVDMFDFRNLEQWVTLRCGITHAHANRIILIARGLRELPVVRERFAAGAISEDHALEIARAGIDPFNDRDAANFASSMTVPQLRRALSFVPRPDPDPASSADTPEPADGGDTASDSHAADETDAESTEPEPADGSIDPPTPDAPETAIPNAPEPATPHEPASAAPSSATEGDHGDDAPREWLQFGPESPGVWGMHLRLTAERGALVELAITTGCDREYRDLHGTTPDPNDPPTTISQLDGFLRMIGDALDVADPNTRQGKPPSDRYLVNIHLEPNGATHLHLGAGLDRPTRDELCCDADIRTWMHHPDGTIGLGRRARVVSPRLRTVVEHRDGGCAIPGCSSRKRLRVHHIVHWLHDGRTDTDNLVCLCPAHHRAVHRGRLVISGNPDAGTLRITNRRGQPSTIGSPIAPGAPQLADARTRATGSPFRPGEQVEWHWVTWNEPVTPRHPAPQPPPPTEPREPTFFEQYPGWEHLHAPWSPTPRRRRRSSRDEGDSDSDDITYG